MIVHVPREKDAEIDVHERSRETFKVFTVLHTIAVKSIAEHLALEADGVNPCQFE